MALIEDGRDYEVLEKNLSYSRGELEVQFSPEFREIMQQFKARPADAGFAVHWYSSVDFCRWLFKKSGMSESDQAYMDPESLDEDQYPRDPKVSCAPDNWPLDLERRGFRLPTESEWEVACRATARTAFGFGSDVALANRFGWFQENNEKHVHTPRELRPNRRGLFDMHGNLNEWVHDWYEPFGSNAVANPQGPKQGVARVRRSGS
jgi:hypothetical protein